MDRERRLPGARKSRGLCQLDIGAARVGMHARGLERVDANHAVALQVRGLGRERERARTAGVAAGDAAVIALPTLERRVVAPVVTAGVLGGGEVVVERALDLVGIG